MHHFFTTPYILDGIQSGNTPIENFAGSLSFPIGNIIPGQQGIIDETIDPRPVPGSFEVSRFNDIIDGILGSKRRFPFGYEKFAARSAVCTALLDSLWKDGHFSIKDTRLALKWEWNSDCVGNMAAFWQTCESAGAYISELGLNISSLEVVENAGLAADGCLMSAAVSGVCCQDDVFDELDDGIPVQMGSGDRISGKFCGDESSWIIFIPFDICRMRLGGSAFSHFAGNNLEGSPDISDTDYFIDCYEVVREMSEDGVIRSAVTCSAGGLACAARKMFEGTGYSLPIDLGGLKASWGAGAKPENLLFSEVPGVLIQISDQDYDYCDSQFLLQDTAYYPVGRPVRSQDPASECTVISGDSRTDVGKVLGGILDALTPEGED